MTLTTRLALPLAALAFSLLAVVLPSLRVRRRTGVWPIVVARTRAHGQRAFALAGAAFTVAGMTPSMVMAKTAMTTPLPVTTADKPMSAIHTETMAQ